MRKTIYQRENVCLLALLRDARERGGLSQMELSTKLGKPQSYISKIERGERRLDVIELRRICQVLNLDLRKFVDSLEHAIGAP